MAKFKSIPLPTVPEPTQVDRKSLVGYHSNDDATIELGAVINKADTSNAPGGSNIQILGKLRHVWDRLYQLQTASLYLREC
jgi:hypothetical protein